MKGGNIVGNKKYYEVKKLYLANSLSYIGFRYLIFDKENDEKIYSFKDTLEFREAITGITLLRDRFNKNPNKII